MHTYVSSSILAMFKYAHTALLVDHIILYSGMSIE